MKIPSIHHISSGGRLTIALTVVWATLILAGTFGGRCRAWERVMALLSLPMGMIDGLAPLATRRGPVFVEEVLFEYLWMIPNLFLLGYGIVAVRRAMGWLLGMYLHRISPGGRLTLALTMVWAVCMFHYMDRYSFGGHFEPAMRLLSLPLGIIDGTDAVLEYRGRASLEQLLIYCLWMIPNLVLLGYGTVAVVRAWGWLLKRCIGKGNV